MHSAVSHLRCSRHVPRRGRLRKPARKTPYHVAQHTVARGTTHVSAGDLEVRHSASIACSRDGARPFIAEPSA